MSSRWVSGYDFSVHRWFAAAVVAGAGVTVAGLAGCGDDEPRSVALVRDAATVDGALTVAPARADAPLDDDDRADPARTRRRGGGRIVGLLLRSTPPGATVTVDGVEVGRTPTYWESPVNGAELEFAFALPKHAVARYRFIPIASGVVHGRLTPVGTDGPLITLPFSGGQHPERSPAPPPPRPLPAASSPVPAPDAGVAGDAAIEVLAPPVVDAAADADGSTP